MINEGSAREGGEGYSVNSCSTSHSKTKRSSCGSQLGKEAKFGGPLISVFGKSSTFEPFMS
ncbi:hypothetical protein Ahy_B06g080543 isoform D [Arachis hypogaea]|uniref:Uncharacterized protein n=1 Tax=Arachis hypogaea TaxID=3818 RepID=A0A444YIA9_ARAHY|nr:hypothetical protein Ahy_B06g080543 isoform D [Arachis hypogaea]